MTSLHPPSPMPVFQRFLISFFTGFTPLFLPSSSPFSPVESSDRGMRRQVFPWGRRRVKDWTLQMQNNVILHSQQKGFHVHDGSLWVLWFVAEHWWRCTLHADVVSWVAESCLSTLDKRLNTMKVDGYSNTRRVTSDYRCRSYGRKWDFEFLKTGDVAKSVLSKKTQHNLQIANIT